MKDTTIPADLIELKARFDAWRASRKYVREPIPDDLWSAAADLSRRYPPSQLFHLPPRWMLHPQPKAWMEMSRAVRPDASPYHG